MKKISQNKRANKVKTPKNPTPRNKFRKWMKGKSSAKKLNALGRLSSKAKLNKLQK